MVKQLSPDELRQKGSLKGFEYQNPERRAFLREIENRIKSAVESFGFDEVEGPMLQPIEFYQAKSGNDLLSHTYTFKDVDGCLLVLRPEMTPTVAFMVAQDEGGLSFPLRWWCNPDLFRKENPQKGRKRQFKQLNVDIFDKVDSGRNRAFDDVEVIAVAISIFEKFGLSSSDIVMKLNSRSLIEKVFDLISINTDQRLKTLSLIDKKSKISEEVFFEELEVIIEKSNEREILLKWLSLKSIDEINKIEELSQLTQSKEYLELINVFELLKSYGIQKYCEFSPEIVRGLGYYTGTIFEAFDRSGSFKRSLMGGGRYDNLTSALGGKSAITAVGFGFGNVPLEEILYDKKIDLSKSEKTIDYYIAIQSNTNKLDAIVLGNDLRKKGNRVVVDNSISNNEVDKVNKQLSRSNKLDVKNTLIIFPDEWLKNEVVIKNMQNHTQITVKLSELIKQHG